MGELLFFAPVYKETIWGGNKMETVFNYDIPSCNTGESWVISAHEKGDCVCTTGKYSGKTLSWLWKNERALFGNYESERFPLLLKVLDAKEDLSIQVHPSDEYAMEHEGGPLGKAECWYILDCKENSTLVIGHSAKSKDELCKLIDENRYPEFINEVNISKGDFIQLDPGTVHSIKAGVMILETQQNSDITYRVYDYDRLQNGKKRELHVEKSKAVITVPDKDREVVATPDTPGVFCLEKSIYYEVFKINVNSEEVIDNSKFFTMMFCISGTGFANGVSIDAGKCFIVPADEKKITLSGNMVLIASQPAY